MSGSSSSFEVPPVVVCPLVNLTIAEGSWWSQEHVATCCANPAWRDLAGGNNVTVTLPDLASRLFTAGCAVSVCASLFIIITYNKVRE